MNLGKGASTAAKPESKDLGLLVSIVEVLIESDLGLLVSFNDLVKCSNSSTSPMRIWLLKRV